MSLREQLLFDSSVWIDFFRNESTPESELLTDYINADDPVVLIPTIIQEVLQGIRDDAQYKKIKDIFSYFTVLQIAPVVAAIGAADLYRSLRKKGLTIRKSNDCLIAFHAIEFSVPLVHSDSDFDVIGKHSKLKIWKAHKK
jgi:predicted nucleic acid-binding protein